jgi:hypothetical protein
MNTLELQPQEVLDPRGRDLAALSREAEELARRALRTPPMELKELIDEAERAAVRLRDELIRLLREPHEANSGEVWGDALERTNVTISLLNSLEYSAAGVQSKPLKQACRILRGLRRTLS